MHMHVLIYPALILSVLHSNFRFSVYKLKIGKQFANVLTTCRCSGHPQGKSEARCQNKHLFIVTLEEYYT